MADPTDTPPTPPKPPAPRKPATPRKAAAPRKTTRTTAATNSPAAKPGAARKPAAPRTAASTRTAAPKNAKPAKATTPATTRRAPAKKASVSKSSDTGGNKWGLAAIIGGVGAALTAGLLALRGSTPRDDVAQPNKGQKAHQADGSDSSASFQAGIADEGTISE